MLFHYNDDENTVKYYLFMKLAHFVTISKFVSSSKHCQRLFTSDCINRVEFGPNSFGTPSILY